MTKHTDFVDKLHLTDGMTQEQYIEHEISLRLLDERFKALEKALEEIDNKFNWIIGLFLSSIVLPVGLHFMRLI